MPAKRDMTGAKVGRWSVLFESGHAGRIILYRCRCECGTERDVRACHLQRAATKSCGCFRRETLLRHRTKHGLRFVPEYGVWCGMIDRTENPDNTHFKDYGGRGIRIAPSWRADFAAFYAEMGPRPTPKHSIDRINNDGHYEPGNCRWATAKEQAANKRPRSCYRLPIPAPTSPA